MRAFIAWIFIVVAMPLSAQTLTQNDIVQVQGLLADMGYRAEVGTVDGLMGPGTARAIAAFESETGMPVTGQPSAALIARLRQLHGQGWDRGQVVATGPSYDCSRATTQSEHAICGNARLARLDRDVAGAYSAALARSRRDDEIKATQRQWLAFRDGCGGDIQCLDNAMTGRIHLLGSY